MNRNRKMINEIIKTERMVIAQILSRPNSYVECIEIGLNESHFCESGCREIFSIMGNLFRDGKEIDLVNISGQMLGTHPSYLMELPDPESTTVNPQWMISGIKNSGFWDQKIKQTSELLRKMILQNPFRDDSELRQGLREFSEENDQEDSDRFMVPDIREVCTRFLHDTEQRILDSKLVGVPTGFAKLDGVLGGWQPGSLHIVAARPGVGKTALALNFAQAALNNTRSVYFLSLEMTDTQLINRMAANIAKISQTLIYRGEMTPEQQDRLVYAITQLSKCKLSIDDNCKQSFEDIMSKLIAIKKIKGIDLLVVDYLTLMRSAKNFKDRRYEIEHMTFSLKNAAKSLNIPVICLAQLNRDIEKRRSKNPVLSDLKESGSIEQDADAVLFIHRDEESEGKAFLRVAKNRHGGVGDIVLNCDMATNSFWEA